MSWKRLPVQVVAAAENAFRLHPSTQPNALAEAGTYLLLNYETALGTAIHSTPLLEMLRKSRPGAKIIVASSGLAVQVFERNPAIDLFIRTPNPYVETFAAASQIRRQLAAAGLEPHCSIATAGAQRSRIAVTSMLACNAVRVGYTVAPELFHVALNYNQEVSLIRNNLQILNALGLEYRHAEPRIAFNSEDLASARRLLANGGVGEKTPIAVLVTQTSVTQKKSWRVDRFVAAADHLARQHGCHILLVGAAPESEAIEQLRIQLQVPSLSVAGKTSISELAALLSISDIALTLDTGIMHIARCAVLPMVIIAPAWSPVIEWLPLNNPRVRILKNADIPKPTPDYIIDEVSVADVTAAIDDLMTQYPPSISARAERVRNGLASTADRA